MTELINPDAKIKITWELGLELSNKEYIPAREVLFEVCNEIEFEQKINTDNLTENELYEKLVDHLKLPRTVILNGLESGDELIKDYRHVYDYYLANISHGFSPKSYKEIE